VSVRESVPGGFSYFYNIMLLKNIFLVIAFFNAYLLSSQNLRWDFVPEKDEFLSSALLDLRSMNETHAGENGFIKVSTDGNSFENESGLPVRFWAVNGASTANKMTDEELAYYARFLAKRGVNMIRYHGSLHPRSGQQPLHEPDLQEIRNIQRVTEAMKKEGIYTTLSLYYTHMVEEVFYSWEIPGYPAGDKKLSGVIFFHEGLKNAYKNWVLQLLTAANPYGGHPLIEEPALAILQLQNEDGVFFYTISAVEPEFNEVMEKEYFKWLLKKYGSIRTAFYNWENLWVVGDDTISGEMTLYNIYDATLHITGSKEKRMKDQIGFFFDKQKDFYNEIYCFLRDSGCKQLINSSNWKAASPVRLLDAERSSSSSGEVMAVNRYYSPDHTGTNSSWRIDPGHFYAGKSVLLQPEKLPLNIKQPDGRVFIVSESGWNLPHKYQSEGPFLVSAYMSLAGIDAFYWFTSSSQGFDENPYYYWTNLEGGQHPLNRWTISTPGQLALFPANAMLFRAGYLKESQAVLHEYRTTQSVIDREIPAISEEQSFDPNRDDYVPNEDQTLLSPLTYLAGKVNVKYDHLIDSVFIASGITEFLNYNEKVIKSSTGEIIWDYSNGLCFINSDMAQGMCGFPVKFKSYKFNDVTITPGNDYFSANVVSMDGLDLGISSKIFVQIGTLYRPAGWQETGATFDFRGSLTEGFKIVNTGTMPWQAECSDVTLTLKNSNIKRASSLDINGYLNRNIFILKQGDSLKIKLPPEAMYILLDDQLSDLDAFTADANLIKIYPNPASEKITFFVPYNLIKNNKLEICNIQGRFMTELEVQETGYADYQVNSLLAGVYLARIKTIDNRYIAGRFVVF